MPQRDSQAHGVEAALTKVANITIELPEIHLLGLPVLFLEVAGVFLDLGERRVFEFDIFRVVASDISYPTIFKMPRLRLVVPFCAGSEYPPREGKGCRIELEDREVANALLSESKNW